METLIAASTELEIPNGRPDLLLPEDQSTLQSQLRRENPESNKNMGQNDAVILTTAVDKYGSNGQGSTSNSTGNRGSIPSQSPAGIELQFGLDQDVLFNEFSTVDAMEWSKTYEQSLLNLGFTNAETTNLDFYDFSRDFKTP